MTPHLIGYTGTDPHNGFDFELYTKKNELVCRLLSMSIYPDMKTCIFHRGLIEPGFTEEIIHTETGFTTKLKKEIGELTLVAFKDCNGIKEYRKEDINVLSISLGMMPGRRLAITQLDAEVIKPFNKEEIIGLSNEFTGLINLWD